MVLQSPDDFLNWNIQFELYDNQIYSALDYRLTPCSSVIVCIPTMLTESQGSSRQIHGRIYTAVTQCLHGSPWIKPSPRTNTGNHGYFELSKTSMLASWYPTDLHGRSGQKRGLDFLYGKR